LKIIYIVETYTDGLGYIDNRLPAELAALGNEVHLITCNLPVYYQQKAAHFGPLVEKKQNITLENELLHFHTCDYIRIGNRVIIDKLYQLLNSIHPDVVLVRGIASPVLGQVVLAKFMLGYKIFTSTGMAYSSLPASLRCGHFYSKARIINFFTRVVPGRIFNYFVTKCIGSTQDCVDCVVNYYGVKRHKTKVISLGVDTDIFYPAIDKNSLIERCVTRSELEIMDGEIVCIWTGRMTLNKAVPLLAQAVEDLNACGYKFRALFIGSGPVENCLKNYNGSIVLPFMPWALLPRYYRAADIAVWPRLITTSTLDASASGLPVVMSNKELASERWEGNGVTYEECNLDSLKEVLLSLKNETLRNKLGVVGRHKMVDNYSWKKIASIFMDTFVSN
jgi:glycosyltransferase involved in cell wall biosynthesis